MKQVTQNQLFCSFYGTSSTLRPQEETIIYQVIGQVENKDILKHFMAGEKMAGILS